MVAKNLSMRSLMPSSSWLSEWLGISFYENQKCSIHVNKYTTVYCIVCKGDPLCDLCWKEDQFKHHKGHQYLQVCTASCRAAIWVDDIKNLIDVSGIQIYVNNSKKVVYLNPPTPKSCRTNTQGQNNNNNNNNQQQQQQQKDSVCQHCHRRLKETNYDFCSIACKKHSMERLRRNNIVISERSRAEDGEGSGSPSASRRPNSRRRKGIPVRSPLM